ncbi:MAG: ABC transporter permease [Treponema sp.]
MTKRNMYFKMILGSLVRRKSRMMTALLAVSIGACVLSGLLTIYYDIPRQMGKVFRSYGANIIFIPNADGANDSGGKISRADAEKIRAAIPAEKLVGFAPYVYKSAKINEQPCMLAGTDLKEAKNSSPYWLVRGEWPDAPKEVLIGNEIAKALSASIGNTIVINTPKPDGDETVTQCRITGIVITGGVEEEFVFMNAEDVLSIGGAAESDGQGVFDVIECSVEGNQEFLESIKDKVEAEGMPVTARLVKRVTESQDAVLSKLQALVWIVTVIVLFLTMICVTTTMMASVAERKKEIGLKKALGASNASVVKDFLGEALVLGIAGGLIGIVLGYFFANNVSINVFARTVSFPLPLVPVTAAVSAVITVISCLIPVRTTVDIDPALVLRGE